MSQETNPKRSMLLYSEYSEKGHQGEIEISTSYTIEVSTSVRTGSVVLTIDEHRTQFSSEREGNHDISRYSIRASELVDLIQKYGKLLP